jgi:hypothetical protein
MEEEKKETTEKSVIEKIKEATEKKLEELEKQGLSQSNIDYLGKVMDVHKDIMNEEYWKAKEEYYMYREYNEGGYSGEYGARRRDSRGRYMEGGYSEGNYGRRGVPGTGRGRYRGEEMIEDMSYHYGNYSDGRDRYGADQKTMESFKYMLKSFKDYYKHLKQEASSQQEVQMLEDVAREISEM